MNIILIGYMGSGKSTVGKLLSEKLNFEFIDLDAYLQEKENLTIPQIFETKGEIYFRKKEHFYLKKLLRRDAVVLSLGGGTPCYGNNMSAILNTPQAHSVYLKSSIPSLVQRLSPEKATRPLIAHLNTDDELVEFIGKHLFERSVFYGQSQLTVVTDGKSVAAIAKEIESSLF